MFRPRAAVPPEQRPEVRLSPFQRRRLAGSWVLPFRDHVLPLIDEHAFAGFFHHSHGAPNRSIALVVAILLLKDFFDLTDQEALDHFAFDRRWHIALDVLDADVSCCQKTLHNFRALLRQHDKARLLFEQLTDSLVGLLEVDTQRQRLDSTHCKSNFATRKRLAIFCESIRLFLRQLQRQRRADHALLPEQLRRRHRTEQQHKNRYPGATTEVARRRLAVVARDLSRLIRLFEKDKEIASWAEFATLRRVLAEQCEVLPEPQQPLPDDDDLDLGPEPVRVRPPKDVPASSLQSPHDPDATYGKKGQGYEVQVCETFGNHSELDPDKPELITHVEVTPSCQSDNRVTVPIIKGLKARDIQPAQLEVDSNFTNSAVIKEARQLGTDVNGPVMGNQDLPGPNEVTVGDFLVDFKDPAKSQCPAGQPLLRQTVDEPAVPQAVAAAAPAEAAPAEAAPALRRVSLAVLATVCLSCELASKCPATAAKAEHQGERALKTTEHELICGQRRRYETTAEFKERQAWRAGVEATNSELKRGHGIGKLAVRGQERVRVAVYLKALACNVKRAAVYLGQRLLAGPLADRAGPPATAEGVTAAAQAGSSTVRLALDC
jgi:hypothetical protein